VRLVICGKQSSDGTTGQLPGALAEILGWPLVTQVRAIRSIDDEGLVAERIVEGGYEVVTAALPAVISEVKEINEPRLSSLRGIMRAKRTPIAHWGLNDLNLAPTEVGVQGSRTGVQRVWTPERRQETELLTGTPDEQARRFVEVMRRLRLL